jgi:hypothetical protein
MGDRALQTDRSGTFLFPLLTPGFYTVRIERQGFQSVVIEHVEVVTNRTSNIRVTLKPGLVSEAIEVQAAGVSVDTSGTALGSNLTDDFYNRVPMSRNVSGLYYASPGVTGGIGTGPDNPSVSGGSGLENQYVADGVNITDGAFGGMGVWGRYYGSLTPGINLAFVKEIQIKTAAFEPQYGKSTGGIVQIVTKSGGNAFHGNISAYLQPQSFEAERLQADDRGRYNQLGKVLHEFGYDIGAELGGYVPHFRDKLFFFIAFNPAWNESAVSFINFHGLDPMPDVPGAVKLRTPMTNLKTAYNYAAKLTWRINDNHQIETSLFGDPASTPFQNNRGLFSFSPTTSNRMSYGTRNWVVRYNGTFSPTWLLNGSFSWGHNYLEDVPFAPDVYRVTSNVAPDPRAGNPPVTVPNCGTATVPCASTGGYGVQGYGYSENTNGDNFAFNVDTQKTFRLLGSHTVGIGYRFEKNFYSGIRRLSGNEFSLPLTNAFGQSALDLYGNSDNVSAVKTHLTDALLGLRRQPPCLACPVMKIPGFTVPQHVVYLGGGNFNGYRSFDASGSYDALYAGDAWTPWKYLTFNLGVRWEQQYLRGERAGYTFTGNWSPRIGVIVDPKGDRKTKLFGNFARYFYAIPLDMAIRNMTDTGGTGNLYWAPSYQGQVPGVPCGSPCLATVAYNQDGTLAAPTFDAAHLVNDVSDPNVDDSCLTTGVSSMGGICWSPYASVFQITNPFAPGTRMNRMTEWTAGVERDLGHGLVLGLRYVDRRLTRIVEDIAGLSPEAANTGVTQNLLSANPGPRTDLFVNPIQIPFDPQGAIPSACVGYEPGGLASFTPGQVPYATLVLDASTDSVASPAGSTNTAVCVVPTFKDPTAFGPGVPNYPEGLSPGAVAADGLPDGFPQAMRKYQAVEVEVNKSFSRNWLLRANYRYAKLQGNYEGAFRNDNGQADPSMSSLFDFVAGQYGLLGDQFAIGSLNTDRRQVMNTFFSYVFDKTFLKNLTLGTGIRIQSGIPINDLRAHPVYRNAGEVPVGGRGVLGRMPTQSQIDMHAEYARPLTDRTRLRVGVDLFNIANSRTLNVFDQSEDRTYGIPNADFKKPSSALNAYQRPFYARVMLKFEF